MISGISEKNFYTAKAIINQKNRIETLHIEIQYFPAIHWKYEEWKAVLNKWATKNGLYISEQVVLNGHYKIDKKHTNKTFLTLRNYGNVN